MKKYNSNCVDNAIVTESLASQFFDYWIGNSNLLCIAQ